MIGRWLYATSYVATSTLVSRTVNSDVFRLLQQCRGKRIRFRTGRHACRGRVYDIGNADPSTSFVIIKGLTGIICPDAICRYLRRRLIPSRLRISVEWKGRIILQKKKKPLKRLTYDP